MKRIEREEQKKIMVEILKYFDKKCRENNINYSLIGGSLIGAIRHKGIIPWDDDIDVILTKENYLKIIGILKNDKNSKYKLLDNDINKDYFFPFPKLVDTDTYVVEPLSLKQIKDYGIYIDIFFYDYVYEDEYKRVKMIKKIKFINGLISRKKINIRKYGLRKSIISLSRNIISSLIGVRNLIRMANKIHDHNLNTKYMVANWPIYPIEKEVQLRKNMEEYIDCDFENIKAMIFKNYDEILKTTFGDYMKLPEKSKRVCHGLEAYWRDENEK